MRKSSFKKHIDQLDEEGLRSELLLLFDKVKEVKTFYKMELGNEGDRKKMYDKAKKEIEAKYKTKSYRKPRRPRIQKVNHIIKEIRERSVFEHEMIDIYLFNAECAVGFMDTYEYYSTPLVNTIKNSMEKAISSIKSLGLSSEYQSRCMRILDKIYFDRNLKKELTNLISQLTT